MPKKILIITPACHFKNAGAAQRDIYASIAIFQKMNYKVALYTIGSRAQDLLVLKSVASDYGIDLRTFLPLKNNWRRFKRVLLEPSLLDGAAYVFDQLCRDNVFLKYLRSYHPDFIFSFCSYSWPVLKCARQNGIKSVFRSHNFESSFFWESLNLNQKLNPLNWLRVLCKYRGEYLAIKNADKVGALPFEQVNIYKKWKASGVEILTLLFLPESLRQPNIHSNKECLDLFYLGASYNVIFHRRGAERLIGEIAPRVLARSPGKFKFHICGSKLPTDLAQRCRNGLIYEGYVPDLESFMQNMDAGVFPVMTGKTMKGKVFETLARAFPMVIPSNCLGGYDLRDGKEVLLADTAESFTEKILRLADVKVRTELSNNACNFAQKEFSEEKIVSVLSKLLSE
ncbi:MAG: hypothetical protein A2921_04135 [Candidatus Magasanikbacteria bacterium RIFCSPLOWO2_01_FULL_43_20b]|uniref:Glycosyltransferase subfamily 4-like N-terminal domain-containing protein n=1 Tax=Candidatus Magasanikbacteria bacterium RIFCSPLOWO2_12_FULL_43_12 TaxID=1798692 RepID=A0A1F6MV04_9BACT|nr:MAG: hypothetical protein A3I93_00785 [Candidatus Magasanikbacteria bacterium RIFCSPLOWO2_02_FULL_43_22]OGH73262.1 MAG: hypothetical protein A2921_04135 [Candidatus Magasanikbacteria bacterium RIFCSPLOWO2_01_FULL_43_20b]OGH75516.1 MAG: hypothetical protein A3G00_00435 [Candidatus Magasanikbacteria bacterium RIFCSPLOWO2_12_FULL_43_12]